MMKMRNSINKSIGLVGQWYDVCSLGWIRVLTIWAKQMAIHSKLRQPTNIPYVSFTLTEGCFPIFYLIFMNKNTSSI